MIDYGLGQSGWPDGIDVGAALYDRPMRPPLLCPYCHRRGAVQRRLGTKPFVVHHCPGPFVLDHVECDEEWAAGYRITIHERR